MYEINYELIGEMSVTGGLTISISKIFSYFYIFSEEKNMKLSSIELLAQVKKSLGHILPEHFIFILSSALVIIKNKRVRVGDEM